MKKVILGISALVILMFVVIAAVNAQSDQKKEKKAKTEAVKDGNSPSITAKDQPVTAETTINKIVEEGIIPSSKRKRN